MYNAANDKIKCTVKNRSNVSGRDAGPVAPGEKGGSSWERAVYNFLATEIRLSSIDIQYEDNSIVSIAAKDIARLQTMPQPEQISLSKLDLISQIETKPYYRQLSLAQDSLQIWQNRYSKFNSAYESPMLITVASPIYEDLNELHLKRETVESELTDFKDNNFLNSAKNAIVLRELENAKKKKTTYYGSGLNWMLCGSHGLGFMFPIEVLFGRMDQRVNFSIEGGYTYQYIPENGINYKQFNLNAFLHFNLLKGRRMSVPLSLGLGYNANVGIRVYHVTGIYYGENRSRNEFSFPVFKNRTNISSYISLGVRWEHWKVSVFGKFNLTQIFDCSQKISGVSESDIIYDDNFWRSVFKTSGIMPMMGVSLRFYF